MCLGYNSGRHSNRQVTHDMTTYSYFLFTTLFGIVAQVLDIVTPVKTRITFSLLRLPVKIL